MPKLKAHDKAIRDAWDDFYQEITDVLIAADEMAIVERTPKLKLETLRHVHAAMIKEAKQAVADIHSFASYAELEAALEKVGEEEEEAVA